MTVAGQAEEVNIGAVEADGRTWNVTVAIENDGIEFVGHLWFADEAWEDEGVRDHGAIPGRSSQEVAAHARALSIHDLTLRFRRAQADQRRHHGLRKLTEQVLENIRHLNKVATSMRAGLLAVDEAAAEIDETEQKLHTMIDELRHFAGVPA
ncbi:MAG: hypothetical protein IPK85_11550 [Gemmatimonadetes bacterium]|nr:hypothetical protein [Gemmatimonadota bacterium]